MYMYIYIYMYVYICIHIYTHTRFKHGCIHTHTRMCTHTHTRTNTRMYAGASLQSRSAQAGFRRTKSGTTLSTSNSLKTERAVPPASFRVDKIRQQIAELLQCDMAQVDVSSLSTKSLWTDVVSPYSSQTPAARRPSTESAAQRPSQEWIGGAESEALLRLAPSRRAIDTRWSPRSWSSRER